MRKIYSVLVTTALVKKEISADTDCSVEQNMNEQLKEVHKNLKIYVKYGAK